MNDIILIRANFKILTQEEGGKRTGFINSGYSPNHIFELFDDGILRTYIGGITFINSEKMYPGEEAEVYVRFFKNGGAEKYIEIGCQWFINEANNPVGIGTILEILDASSFQALVK